MTLPVITGLNKTEITKLLLSKSSFDVIGLRGGFNAGIKYIETYIEHLGLTCRVKVDAKGALAQGGALGALMGTASLPVSFVLAAAATVVSAGHTLATYNPDYEIIKDYVNKKLKVIYKK
ncbi:hypothetical protein PS870_05956 [Pseudomonas fluorescens]|uniref:Uncharacterized protein n=1 Tax=Pseudomonas fluorescens TaxID=294 RepID=A0A5E7QDY0_PSEFL|nr:hypothetical protein [Pseudomonas fluorescens]VVP59067.1 hypothetical protein PS870_05956 [Pseudomonas fluorescens]